MIRTIIIENEKMQSDHLVALLSKHFPEIDILKVCDNIPEGVQEVRSLKPQLIFLDVELPPYTGFDLLEQTQDMDYEVIFTTSFNQYAVRAFRFCALDYLEKPLGLEDLKESIDRYKKQVDTGSKRNREALLHNLKQTDPNLHKVSIPVLGGKHLYTVSEIILCKAESNYTEFHLTEGRRITASQTLGNFEKQLHDYYFCRVHASYLINLRHVKKYMSGGEGGVVELTDTKEVDVSRRKKAQFKKMMRDLGWDI